MCVNSFTDHWGICWLIIFSPSHMREYVFGSYDFLRIDFFFTVNLNLLLKILESFYEVNFWRPSIMSDMWGKGEKTKIDCRLARVELKLNKLFSLLYSATHTFHYPRNMRKIYLICIVFWRQTDGKIHDELIIVSLFPSTPRLLYLFFLLSST
jgi:hypothetical protein